jgi:serine/threonine protein kinase
LRWWSCWSLTCLTGSMHAQGTYYIINELIACDSYTPTDNLRRYARQLLEAVAYLHGRNIVHGDIKTEVCGDLLFSFVSSR